MEVGPVQHVHVECRNRGGLDEARLVAHCDNCHVRGKSTGGRDRNRESTRRNKWVVRPLVAHFDSVSNARVDVGVHLSKQVHVDAVVQEHDADYGVLRSCGPVIRSHNTKSFRDCG